MAADADADADADGLPLRLPVRLLAFALRTLGRFRDNKGLVLSSAIAFNALLSAIPLLVISITILSAVADRGAVMAVVDTELARLLSPEAAALLTGAVEAFLDSSGTASLLGAGALLFFAIGGFGVLQNAIDVVFRYRHGVHDQRPIWRSTLLSVAFVLAFVAALLLRVLALRLSGVVAGVGHAGAFLAAALLMAGVYRYMPVGHVRRRLAWIGGFTAAALWEGVQGLLVWYFAELSAVNVIYGSIAGVVVALVTLEVGASIVLFGAQVIAELERSEDAGVAWDVDPGA